MDWINDFVERFEDYKEIQSLKADKFYGSLNIHFKDGLSMIYDLKLSRQAKSKNKND